jgi:glycosyltransferase involved in cell wall biosynthesis
MSVSTTRTIPGAPPRRRRVLIFRSCRIAQFEHAVRYVRGIDDQAEIVALSHRGHLDALRAAGADRVIEIPGRRFGLLRTPPSVIRRLRREAFDDIVIPQMTASASHSGNLHRLAATLGGRRFTILPGTEPEQTFEGAQDLLASMAVLSGIPRWLDAPLLLTFLAAACIAKRRTSPIPPPAGKRRILLAISSLGLGGAQVQLAELLNRMPVDEYEVDLLALGGDGEFSRQWLKRGDVEVMFVKQWPGLVASILEIVRLCRQRKYDIVHTWLFMANVVVVAAARLASVPVVIASVRNLSVWKRERWYRKWWHRAADVLASHAADKVTVNANALVRDHARWALMRPSPIEVVHNGLDPSQFVVDRREARRRLCAEVGVPEEAVLVGTVGRLAPEKDQATFIRLFSEVQRIRPEAHAVVIGNGDLRPRLESIAAGLGLARQLTFLGARKDARQLMAGLDVLVLSSVSEGFPNVLLEATLLGVPSAATDIAGNPDVLLHDESLFPIGDYRQGAKRVLALLAHPAATRRRTEELRERARTLFTSERSVRTWLDLYRRCLGEAALQGRRKIETVVSAEAR